MWCDDFDADLLAVIPGAATALGESAGAALLTYSTLTGGKWVHSCAVSVNGLLVWRPPVRLMERLMYDLRGWTVLPGDEREQIRRDVLASLESAARRLTSALVPAVTP